MRPRFASALFAILATGCAAFDTGGVSGTPRVDAAPIPTLVDRSLLVRYYLDEAASGQESVPLLDTANDPLDLTIEYVGDNPMFVEVDGNRGLYWNASGDAGGPLATFDQNSKIYQALNGRKTITIEAVIDLKNGVPEGSRIVNFGDADIPRLSFEVVDDHHLQVDTMGAAPFTSWPIEVPNAGRVVAHVVGDGDQLMPEDRIKLYVDGAPLLSDSGPETPLDQPIRFPVLNGLHVGLGNHVLGGRSFEGILYYAAVYTEPLTADEIANNVAVLAADDDRPDTTGQRGRTHRYARPR